MKKILIIILFFFPFFVFADTIKTDDVFKAKVVRVDEEIQKINENSDISVQQNLRLVGLEGERKNKEYYFFGINDFELIKSNSYKNGDKVLLLESFDAIGNPQYYVVDFVRTGPLLALFIIFLLILFSVGRVKALRSLLSLFLTFVLILKFIIPNIIAGSNPVTITLIGSLFVLVFIIYITEGFNPVSHLASLSIVLSLIFSVFLSWSFIKAARLSGVFSEEVASVATIGNININFQGLLLAGIIIGLLGVLDDVVIAQISAVEQIHLSDQKQSKKELFRKSYKVGVSHISSMTNTLFLAYAGVSLPLLVLLVSGESVFSNMADIFNNQQVATEIVRTLAGSIGLVLSVPIATLLAVSWFKKRA